MDNDKGYDGHVHTSAGSDVTIQHEAPGLGESRLGTTFLCQPIFSLK